MIRVALPYQLQVLASCDREVSIDVDGPITQRAVLDALENCYPMLKGTIREHVTLKRRPRVRFFAAGEDVTHDPPDARLPKSIAAGDEPFRIVGAVSGG